MSEAIAELTEENFSGKVSQGVSLVDFWAPWCAPCRMQTPILERVSQRVGDLVTVAKVNVDEAGGVAQRYGVQSIPTLVLLKDGDELRRFVGVQSEDVLVSAIEGAL
ncbi:MAG TPA: thioredoxin [Candidatus Hydrogenedentes bacterium]|nr:thioredoxin [Candidatus Hydrogenedentota bacterium]